MRTPRLSDAPFHHSDAAMSSSQQEIRAIVQLLDDPDAEVQSTIRDRLSELGREALPELRAVRDEADGDLRDRIDSVVHDLHVGDLERCWHAVLDADEVDLERGAFLLALYRFPTLDVQAYRERLDGWADRVRPRIDAAEGERRALALAEFMTDDLGFRGNEQNYYDPNNSYLNRVMDRKTGIPISLSVLYLLLAKRLNVPVYGVNLPVHFLVKYAGPTGEVFIDLFNDGTTVPKEDCIRFLMKAGIRPLPAYFEVARPRDVLLRMVRNLLAIAKKSGQSQTADELTRLIAPYDESVSR